MRLIRYLIFAVVIIVFLIASMITIISGGENIPVVIATAVLVLIGFPSTTEWVWDKVGPARGLGASDKQPTSVGTVEDYLNGRLRAFADEEKRFIPLALTLKPAYQEGDAQPTDDIEAIFQQNNGRFILLGDPGAGKSTTLRHLMRQAITNYLRYPKSHRIPVWINLGEGANPIQPEELLKHWWDNRCYLPGTPEQHIRHHNLLLFFDGLNEMPLDSRSARAKLLREFLEKNPEIQVIVTCRVGDYGDDEALKLSLPSVRVLPLDDKRVQDFILRNDGDANLWDTIAKDDALRALAANPYNLYQLILISQEPNSQNLPRHLNQLYRRYLKVTYDRYTLERKKKRDQETPLLKLPLPKLEKRLQRLAFSMLAGGKGTSVNLEWALYWRRRWHWGQQTIRDGVNLGVLMSDGRSLRFYHQSLHGYFAIEPLSQALNIDGGIDRFTKNPVALIRQIGDLGAAGIPAINPLIAALGNIDWEVRRSAVEALGNIGDDAVEPLIPILGSTKRDFRSSAATALGNIGDPRAIQPLMTVLGDRQLEVRESAATALGKIGEAAIEPLMLALDDSESDIRSSAAEALGQIGDVRAVEPLIRLLNYKGREKVLVSAAEALGQIGDVRAVEPLIQLFDYQLVPRWKFPRPDLDSMSIITAARVLVDFGEIAVKPLIAALNHTNPNVRYRIAEMLGKIGDEQAVEPLLIALNDRHWYVRINATVALGEIKDERAVGPLIKMLEDEEVDIRFTAEALERIGTPEALAAVVNWR